MLTGTSTRKSVSAGPCRPLSQDRSAPTTVARMPSFTVPPCAARPALTFASGDAVEHAMVRLADDGQARLAQPLDDPHLPERLVPIERLGEQPADQLLQFGLSSRRWKRAVAHVVLAIELGLVDPDGPPLFEGNEHHPLPITGNVLEAGLDQR